jgi:phosphatidylglycerophosphate synthase
MAERRLTEGELWAREQLEQLLRARFTPAAWVRFLAASFRRSAQVRAARPEHARRAYAWLAAGGATWVALAAAGAQPFRRRARAGLAWWALVALMLDWHLGMFETEDGRPRPLSAADALTLLRAWLAPVAFDSPTPSVCAIAAATDALDGPLARRVQPTRAGRDLEGLVDASFGAAALRGALRRGWIARPAAVAELARLGAGFAHGLVVYFGRAEAPDPGVTRAARATTPVRAAALLAAGTGRRRLAGALLAGASLASMAAIGRALTSRRAPASSPASSPAAPASP